MSYVSREIHTRRCRCTVFLLFSPHFLPQPQSGNTSLAADCMKQVRSYTQSHKSATWRRAYRRSVCVWMLWRRWRQRWRHRRVVVRHWWRQDWNLMTTPRDSARDQRWARLDPSASAYRVNTANYVTKKRQLFNTSLPHITSRNSFANPSPEII